MNIIYIYIYIYRIYIYRIYIYNYIYIFLLQFSAVRLYGLGTGAEIATETFLPSVSTTRGWWCWWKRAAPEVVHIIYIYRINQNPVQCMNMKHPAYWLKPRTRKHMRWLWICNWNYDWIITFWGPCPPLFHFDIWASWVDPGILVLQSFTMNAMYT